jgi:hypothetical protein
MKLLKTVYDLLNPKPIWHGSPETFLAMILELQSMMPNTDTAEVTLRLGKVMVTKYRISLAPYADLRELIEKGVPDRSKLHLMRKEISQLSVHFNLLPGY